MFLKAKKESAQSIYTKGNYDKYILLAGNPNVGKSTIFNALTGLKQHTGNWSGKTVDAAYGLHIHNDKNCIIADLPGCYSIKAHSQEEFCAASAIQSQSADGIVVVCDACSLERNMNLVLQICEITNRVVVAVNFMDSAAKKGTDIDLIKLRSILNVPVVAVNARKKKGLHDVIKNAVETQKHKAFKVNYGRKIEYAVKIIEKSLDSSLFGQNKRYVSLRILENDQSIREYAKEKSGNNSVVMSDIISARHKALNYLYENGISEEDVKDIIAITIVRASHSICKKAVRQTVISKSTFVSRTDKILTDKLWGFLIMAALIMAIFYITVKGANYPSKLLSAWLFSLEKHLHKFLLYINLPNYIANTLVYGGYRVLSWVVSVMFPPMAIFFPLFTILEDVGYLPRIAFNLDKCFKKCNACGKQSLTTCMGFGCNAAGVTGARIIDSPREKLVAVLTNSFIPCNGRFPAMISVITVFLTSAGAYMGLRVSFVLLLFIVLSVGISLLASKLLSKTILKGMPSSFALELPPFRKPQFGKIIVHSVFDRTIFVLARAAYVAFPAGIIIYVLSNVTVGGSALSDYMCRFFNPLGTIMGLDGVIITAFILGIPANEIVLPLCLMMYSSGTVLTDVSSVDTIYKILSANGWNYTTAICVILFFIMHWPCSTTLLTIKKETGSLKWTIIAFLLPTLFGIISCIFAKAICALL